MILLFSYIGRVSKIAKRVKRDRYNQIETGWRSN
jgi:hypothetical protein